MKNANTKLRARLLKSWAAVSVLAASLLFTGILTGCPNGSGPNRPNESAQPNGPVQPTDPSIFETDGLGKITGCKCANEALPADLIIPAKIGDEVITEIGWYAFAGCNGLKSIDFSACTKLNRIDNGAFASCTGLTQLMLPESLTEIGTSAFVNCKLKEVKLTKKLTKIDTEAFKNCPIETLYINSDINSNESDKAAWLNEDSIRANLKTLKLESGITIIPSSAFSGCTGLTSITLPENLTEIGGDAFSGCKGLTSISLPASLTEIGWNAFSGCKDLTSITLPKNLTKIRGGTFLYCTGLTSITLPASLTEIGRYAFLGCTGLTSITLPEKLTKIGDKAFNDCTGLNGTIIFPANIETIWGDGCYPDEGTFRNCINLQGLDFSACTNLTFIPAYAFYGCKALSEVKLPENIKVIGINTFEGCTSLQNITLPANLTSIKANAFKGCTNLTSVVFKNTQNWNVYNNYNCTDLHNYIYQSHLQNEAYAAKYLRNPTNNGGYCNKFWKRN